MTTSKDHGYNLFYNPLDVQGQCLLKQIRFIKKNTCKFVFHIILSIITLGIPRLIMFWYPAVERFYYFDFVDTRHSATHFWIKNYDDQITIVQKINFRNFQTQKIKAQTVGFINRYLQYYLDQRDKVRAIRYQLMKKIPQILDQQQTTGKYKGLSNKEVQNLRKCYGPGAMVIQKKSIFQLFVQEVVRPMFLFVIYSIIVWFWTEYYYYVGIIIVSLIISLVVNLYQARVLYNKIHSMAFYETQLNVLRQGKISRISSLEIVPGDIVFFKDTNQSSKDGLKIPFDGKVLDGSLLINECSLTGESVPVVKKVCKNLLTLEIDKGSQIFEGTSIIQVNSNMRFSFFQGYRQTYGVPVCVHKTNFYTSKGGLIRIIQFPKQQQNLFQKQSSKFLIFVFFFTWLTYGILAILHSKDVTFISLLQKCMDIVTISVPPALPVSMTLGIIYAVEKLQSKNIFCTSQNNIIKGGSVDRICFDKTGTLTQIYMDFYGVLPFTNGKFRQILKNQDNKRNEDLLKKHSQITNLSTILYNFGANHSLIQNLKTKQIIGDPMELKTFQFGDFKFDYRSSAGDVLFNFKNQHNISGQVFKVYQFDSDVQRMTVACKTDDNKFYAFTKGSPQILKSLFNLSSSDLKLYDQQLKKYSSKGYRILAIGSKRIDYDIFMDRAELQSDLQFQGFTIFENMLKPQSHGAILQLRQADIQCSMITGDSPLTACCIGLQCQIADQDKNILIFDKIGDTIKYLQFNSDQKQTLIDTQGNSSQTEKSIINISAKYPDHQICFTGNIFNELFQTSQTLIYSQELKQIFMRTKIFARAKPSQKAKVISIYQSFGYIMGMCGDGANDCGALKQAEIGLSLSQTQASISAPFTSKTFNITPMVELIKECRAGLATNFSLFNIMAMYSFIQYTTAWICQYYYAYPSDLKFVYWDFVGNFLLLLTYGYIGTADKLTKEKPLNSLFSLSNVFQILSMFFIQLVGQLVCMYVTIHMFAQKIDYYSNGGEAYNISYFHTHDNLWNRNSSQVNTLFLFTNFFYMASFVGFSIENPWRKRFYTCWPFLLTLILVISYSAILILFPSLRFKIWQLEKLTDSHFLVFIFCVSAAFSWIIYANQKYLLQPLTNYLRKNNDTAKQFL